MQAHNTKASTWHWHDNEEVLVFLDLQREGFVRLGDMEYVVATQTSIGAPPRMAHCFGLQGHGSMRAVAIMANANTVPGHRVFKKEEEPPQLLHQPAHEQGA